MNRSGAGFSSSTRREHMVAILLFQRLLTGPNDSAIKVDIKVGDFLNAGVTLIWVVNPDSRSVHVYRAETDDAI